MQPKLLNLEAPLQRHVRFSLRRLDPLVSSGLIGGDARVEIRRLTRRTGNRCWPGSDGEKPSLLANAGCRVL